MKPKEFGSYKGTSAMKTYPKKEKVKAAFDEVSKNEPKIVAHTRAKFGAKDAQKQKVAIALSKARKT